MPEDIKKQQSKEGLAVGFHCHPQPLCPLSIGLGEQGGPFLPSLPETGDQTHFCWRSMKQIYTGNFWES